MSALKRPIQVCLCLNIARFVIGTTIIVVYLLTSLNFSHTFTMAKVSRQQ